MSVTFVAHSSCLETCDGVFDVQRGFTQSGVESTWLVVSSTLASFGRHLPRVIDPASRPCSVAQIDQQRLAEELVEQARAEG